MDSTAVTSTAAPTLPVYASWGSRVWAATLDAIFNFLLLIPVAILVGLVRSDLANYAGVVLSLVYFTLGAVAIDDPSHPPQPHRRVVATVGFEAAGSA